MKFDLSGGRHGLVAVIVDDVGYSKLATVKMADFDCLNSAKARTLVCLSKGTPSDAVKKAKLVVDAP